MPTGLPETCGTETMFSGSVRESREEQGHHVVSKMSIFKIGLVLLFFLMSTI